MRRRINYHPLKHIKTFGNSMAPFFLDGDVIEIKKIPFNKIVVNDFVTIARGKYIFTHRVIYKNVKKASYLITKGDNNPLPDGKIFPKQIVGIVKSLTRNNQKMYTENFYLFQSKTYFSEIIKVKNALEKQQINFVFLKGLPIHLFFEKSIPRRMYLDCDILIAKSDFSKTKKILHKLGFLQAATNLINKDASKTSGEQPFYKQVKKFPVVFDIHTQAISLMEQIADLNSLYPHKKMQELTELFLTAKQTVTMQNEEFPILSTEHLIVYLAFHLFHHNCNGYYRYLLLDSLLRKKPMDFEKISALFIDFQLQNFIYPVFVLLKKYYYTPLPSEFIGRITPDTSSKKFIAKHILNKNIFADEARIAAGVTRFWYLFYLSPNPLITRLLIFTNANVLRSILWAGKRRLQRLLNNNFFLF